MNKGNRLIIVNQEKGGVAKTFLTIHLTMYLRLLGLAYRPVDFDYQRGLLCSVFPKPESASISPDVRKLLDGDSLLPKLFEKVIGGEKYIVDCGANTLPAWNVLFRMTHPKLLENLKSAGVQMTLICPISSDVRTTENLSKYRDLYQGATIVLVLIREYKGEHIDLPEHPADLVIELPLAPKILFAEARKRGMSIDAIRASTGKELALLRGFAKDYLPLLHSEFAKIKEHLS